MLDTGTLARLAALPTNDSLRTHISKLRWGLLRSSLPALLDSTTETRYARFTITQPSCVEHVSQLTRLSLAIFAGLPGIS